MAELFFGLLATAIKTYIGSFLFRTSAYIGAKQASSEPFWFRDLSCQIHLVPGHLVPFFRPGHFVTLFGSLRPIIYNGVLFINASFLFVKIYFLNQLLYKKMTLTKCILENFII